MASKFQNRLVGTIVLVALGVIVLPGLLDGQKKHYQDEFAAIPLVPKPAGEEPPAPTGKAYVVQLGALKNADKVNEIVGKLRGAGFRVYTSPSTPVQGKITRILVGPDASKDKLKNSLGELQKISGLSGVVMGYTPN